MGNLDPKKLEMAFESTDEEKISELLARMPRAEAPADFGFRVKARIAEAKPINSRPMWLPTALKAAAPLGLAVFIGGYFAVTSLYQSDDAAPPQAAVETAIPAPISQPAPEAQAFTPPDVAAEIPEQVKPPVVQPIRQVAVRRVAAKRSVANAPTLEDSSSGGSSYDISSAISKEPSPTQESAKTIDTPAKGTPAGEVLTRIGVNALFGGNGWKAESVTPNTAASRAGVKAGDIIESVDDQDMTDLGSVAKPATGKKLRVKRDGKSVDIVIDP
jgi:membrane-associated protease RseP (regulator of RpoE activity)